MLNREQILKKWVEMGGREKLLIKNISYSFLSRLISIFCNLFAVRLSLQMIGSESYGLWLTLSSIIGWISFFDLGINNGLKNRLTEALAKKEYRLASIYLSSSYFIIFVIGIVISIIGIIASLNSDLSQLLNTKAQFQSDLKISAIILILAISSTLFLQTINTLITSRQQLGLVNLLGSLGQVIILILLLIFRNHTPIQLFQFVLIFQIPPIIILIALTFIVFNNKNGLVKPQIALIEWNKGKEVLNIGWQFLIIQLSSMVLFMTDNLIITKLFNPSEVTNYNLAYKFFSLHSMIFAIIIAPFWTLVTEAIAKNDIHWVEKIQKRLIKVWLLSAVVVGFMIFSANFIYNIWLGNIVEIPFIYSLVMGIYVLVMGWNTLYAHFFNGMGALRVQFVFSISNVIINIPLSIYLSHLIGPVGVPVATVICLSMSGIYYPFYFKKLLAKYN